jgi:hypothetical protein
MQAARRMLLDDELVSLGPADAPARSGVTLNWRFLR